MQRHLAHIDHDGLWELAERWEWDLHCFEEQHGIRPEDPRTQVEWVARRHGLKALYEEIWDRMDDETRAEVLRNTGPWNHEWMAGLSTYREYFHMPSPNPHAHP